MNTPPEPFTSEEMSQQFTEMCKDKLYETDMLAQHIQERRPEHITEIGEMRRMLTLHFVAVQESGATERAWEFVDNTRRRLVGIGIAKY